MELTQEKLKELLDYNPDTGVFTWKVARSRCKAGGVAGGIRQDGYRQTAINGKIYLNSRLAFLFMDGYFPENEVDHINRIKADNKWGNLRHVGRQCNMRNAGRYNTNTTGVTGVRWVKARDKWRAGIGIDGKECNLGRFKNFIDAVKARWRAEVKHNWPGCNSHTDAYCYLHEG